MRVFNFTKIVPAGLLTTYYTYHSIYKDIFQDFTPLYNNTDVIEYFLANSILKITVRVFINIYGFLKL